MATSIGNMIKRIAGLTIGDVSEWEGTFISDIVHSTSCGRETERLSAKQVEIIERIFNKHFAD